MSDVDADPQVLELRKHVERLQRAIAEEKARLPPSGTSATLQQLEQDLRSTGQALVRRRREVKASLDAPAVAMPPPAPPAPPAPPEPSHGDRSAGRGTKKKAIVAAGIVGTLLAIAAAVVALDRGGKSSTTPAAAASSSSQSTAASSVAAGSVDADHAAIEAFVPRLGHAVQVRDVPFLLDTLDPAVLQRYTRDQCNAQLSSVPADPTADFAVHGFDAGPEPYTYTTDGQSTVVQHTYAVSVAHTASGVTTATTIHLSVDATGSVHWFTDCTR